ncbi:Protein CBG15003 [Caenorhabditis briggsae]|uniref:Protein CBG15003 n=2 Tax=Caenorhabditis briggsae TaxID=6238 RepID=A8XL69_CAEBR|nr:Protein CBG15003 [Caenorhabditis briggsae]ULT93857.1 hypothetical protein L3Y34_003395 [Caenorhabditis briggsae]CAP33394.1 Protein CBG15003 [Caenorhabditis briggsae]
MIQEVTRIFSCVDGGFTQEESARTFSLDGLKKLPKSSISALATKMLAAIGKFGATHHAFRRGGANHMRATGYSMEEIQARGRWRSLAGLQRYIKDVPRAQGCLHPQENGIGIEEEDEDSE